MFRLKLDCPVTQDKQARQAITFLKNKSNNDINNDRIELKNNITKL